MPEFPASLVDSNSLAAAMVFGDFSPVIPDTLADIAYSYFMSSF